MVQLSMLAALGVVLMLIVRFLFPSAPFLEYDMGDAVIPTAFLTARGHSLMLVIVSLIQASSSASSGWIGFVMHVISTARSFWYAGFYL